MKFAQSFTYNGHHSSEMDLVIAADDDNVSYNLGLQREIVTGNTTHNRFEVFGINSRYSDMLELTFTVIKNPCFYESQKDRIISREELRKITGWLTSPVIPMKLSFEDYWDISVEPVDFFGNFTNLETFSFGELYGLKLTFLCSAPWGYTKEKHYSSTVSGKATLTIENTSDDWILPVYPYVTVHPNENGTITIKNKTEDNSFSFYGTRGLTTFIDCQKLMVSDEVDLISFRDLGWTTDTLDTLYWPRLVHGVNELEITGYCDIDIKCRYPRKVGEV